MGSSQGIVSQNFGDFSTYSASAADDFVVTDAAGWTVSEVDVSGLYFNGSGPANSFDVTFYNDAGGAPGSVACAATGSSFTATIPSFSIPLSSPCSLAAGTYWVGVAANMNFSAGGEFGWIVYNGAPGGAAMWENPGGGFGVCPTWGTVLSCLGIADDSMSFAIVGHVNTVGAGISLTVGLAEDNGNPTQCGTSTNLSATVGDSINFCYTVTNNSAITLNFQTLSDDVSGVIFTNMPQTIAPGASFQYNRIITATTSESPTSTWVAADELPGYSNSSGAFSFIDITGSGTALSLSDDSSADITSPFSFNFYGDTSNQFCVNNNGHVVFATSSFCSGNFSNQSFPASAFANPVFLPFWDDLFTGGNVYFNTVGSSPNRQFVVEWAGKDTFDTPGLSPGYTFELVLNESDGSIDFNYANIVSGSPHDNGASATVGLQFDTSVFNSFSEFSASLSNSQNIHWTASSPTSFSASAQVTLDVGAPILSLSPTSLSATAVSGTSTSQTLNIGNTGNRDLDWDLTEAPASAIPKIAAKSVYVPNYKNGAVAASPRPVPQEFRRASKSANGHKSPFGGVPAYGETFASSGFNYVSFDASNAGTLNTITALGSYFFAGTFASNDFSVEYAVDYPFGDLYGIDTATGATQLIGNTGVSGGTISGIRWDPTSGLTYLMSPSSSCGQSTLYTLDLSTGATQQVGVASGVCLIDIAIDPSGVMYSVDIVGNNTVIVDKTSGAAQVIGPTGVDFNFAEGMDIDPSTGIIYFAGFDLGTFLGGMYIIDPTTGAAQFQSPTGNSVELDAMAIAVASGPCATPSDVPWLSENPISGTTPAGGNDPVAVTFDATSLTSGTYTANVCVNTNDTTQRHVAVPVTFVVTPFGNDIIFQDGFDGP
ncbi:MAG: choice-of-anchor R domain-containing protein [Ilumatobacteraceae bacterium]